VHVYKTRDQPPAALAPDLPGIGYDLIGQVLQLSAGDDNIPYFVRFTGRVNDPDLSENVFQMESLSFAACQSE